MKMTLFILCLFLSLRGFAESLSVKLMGEGCAVVIGASGSAVFPDLKCYEQSGSPAVPSEIMEILVPPGTVLETIQYSLSDEVTHELIGTFDVLPVPVRTTVTGGDPIVPPGVSLDENGCNTAVYSANTFYNEGVGGFVPSQLREWKILRFRFYPFRYNPVSKKLQRIESVVLNIDFEEDEDFVFKDANVNLWKKNRRILSIRVVNFLEFADAYDDFLVQRSREISGAQHPSDFQEMKRSVSVEEMEEITVAPETEQYGFLKEGFVLLALFLMCGGFLWVKKQRSKDV